MCAEIRGQPQASFLECLPPCVCDRVSLGLELSYVGQTGWRTSSRTCCPASPLAVTGVAGAILPYIIVYMGYRDRILRLTFVRQVLWGLDLLQVQNGFLLSPYPAPNTLPHPFFLMPLLDEVVVFLLCHSHLRRDELTKSMP